MNKKMGLLAVIFFVISLVTFSNPTLAQDETGSIQGAVYRDVNLNGLCSNEGEARVGNIPIEIINDDTEEFVRIVTAPDGTYVYNNVELGLWRVTVVPGTGWRFTSQQTREIELTEDLPDAFDVDFCIVEIEDSETTARPCLNRAHPSPRSS